VSEERASADRAAEAAVLEFDGVDLSFDRKVLDGVSFRMVAGETRVILGAAGSGKSVLLKAAIGLVRVDSGRVVLLGEDITGLAEKDLFAVRANVGVLFQEGGLFDSLTVGDNVAYPLENQQVRGQVPVEDVLRRVREALRFVELEQTLEQHPAELSGGMRRRVGIARAVVTDPPLVLYDSPTAGLDPITANLIMALIAKERDTKGSASLIVTHRYQDGQLMADFRYNSEQGELVRASGDPSREPRTIFMVMRDGQIVFEGDKTALEKSADPYVRKFVRR
jgi:phospholipid/cholesterol/gamma-HCH transport system ATP-binding protein